VKTLSPSRALKSSSFVIAGEKVLDSIAIPAIAMRGSSFFELLELQLVVIAKRAIKQIKINDFFILMILYSQIYLKNFVIKVD